MLATEFSITAEFHGTSTGEEATLGFSTSSDVTCKWQTNDGPVDDSTMTLLHREQIFLKCNRNSHERESYVMITRRNGETLEKVR